MSRASVVVVGGGIAGLAAAYELSGGRAGPTPNTPRVEVIEGADRFGGALATAAFAGRTIDLGADGVLARRPEALELLGDLGLSDRVEPIAASGAWVWARGALRELPRGLTLGVPVDPAALRHWPGLGRRGRLALSRDRWWPARLDVGEDTTIGRVVRAKLGSEISSTLVEPMIGGIQAGRIDDLSARSVFPALYEAARAGGSLTGALRRIGPSAPGPAHVAADSGPTFVTLTSGVGSVVEALCQVLAARDVVLRRATSVTALRRIASGPYRWEVDTPSTTTAADAVVLATPAPTAATLAGRYDPAIAALATITSAGAAMVTFSLARDGTALPPRGTGVLVPLGTPWRAGESMMVTALTFLDRKWPHLALDSDVLLRAHVGRSDDERWCDLEDEALIERVYQELTTLLGHVGARAAARVQRWPHGLPQYRVGHGALVEAAERGAAPIGIALAGNAYHGVGVPASIGSGRRAARAVLDRSLGTSSTG